MLVPSKAKRKYDSIIDDHNTLPGTRMLVGNQAAHGEVKLFRFMNYRCVPRTTQRRWTWRIASGCLLVAQSPAEGECSKRHHGSAQRKRSINHFRRFSVSRDRVFLPYLLLVLDSRYERGMQGRQFDQ